MYTETYPSKSSAWKREKELKLIKKRDVDLFDRELLKKRIRIVLEFRIKWYNKIHNKILSIIKIKNLNKSYTN